MSVHTGAVLSTEARQRGLANSHKVQRANRNRQPVEIDWDTVIARFKRYMAEIYEGET